jgi:TonB-dependent SusC/RagA subfamily outer membrane receptor
VLKDASSAAIYGSRGSSGVIMVTTKMGKPGKVNVSANVEYGSQKVTRRVKMMDAQQFIETYVDAKNNAWTAQGGNASDPNSARPSDIENP